ncbi:hypothetical protein DPF_1489 [Desulfoplanes formicivorans]|uniref:Uncharacterized protein n=2 Tax=Desulfoplanes formicivorans TaxID=1592317 RepID=A0A194AHG4_9BACT|nr:hypothetical protein DPF_1489 [Desulfoplanes formicivorans]
MWALGLIFGATTTALGLMSPQYYVSRSEQARIKAICTVEHVHVLDAGEFFTTKRVTFRRTYGVTKETPPVFTGICRSIETDFQKRHGMVGPDLYFYPRKGDLIYVTITEPDGEITSMTPITPGLEHALRTAPQTIRYGMSRAFVRK